MDASSPRRHKSAAASPPPLTSRQRSPRNSNTAPSSLAALAATRRSVSHDSYAQSMPSPLEGSALRSPRRAHNPSSPSAASAASGTSRGTEEATTASERDRKLTPYESDRAKKAAEVNAKSIEARIRNYQREEERIWREIDDLRRKASIREHGKVRAAEKRIAAQTIQEGRELQFEEKRAKANQTKKMLEESAQKMEENAEKVREQRNVMGQDQRRLSAEILRQKRLSEKQVALRNTERAVAVQRSQLESRIKMAQQKSERIQVLREQAERHRIEKEQLVHEAESKLPALEAEEMVCLQRLQNSRVATQSVLEELESSFGSRASVASVLRARQHRPMELLNEAHESHEEHHENSMHVHGVHGVHAVHEEANCVNGTGSDVPPDGYP